MAVQEIDELKIYRGCDYYINDKIIIRSPTLGEICDYGDNAYFSMIRTLTSTPTDMMWQLDDIGIDFTQIDNFTLFSQIICGKTENMTEEKFQLNKKRTSIVLGDLNLFDFDLCTNENGEIVMYNKETDTLIDGYTYRLISEAIRKMHFLKENIAKPANESTRIILIEDARDEYLMQKNKTPSSYLLNLISTMINCPGFKYNHSEVWNMKINAFLDSVKRITKIQNAELLLQSGYSGFGINLKEIPNKQLDWLGDLD